MNHSDRFVSRVNVTNEVNFNYRGIQVIYRAVDLKGCYYIDNFPFSSLYEYTCKNSFPLYSNKRLI